MVNMKRKSMAALCAAVLTVGCMGVIPASADDAALNSFEATSENVKILGRGKYLEDKGALWFGLTDSGVEFTFTGKEVNIDLLADGNGANDGVRIKTYGDGELKSDFMLQEKKLTYNLEFAEEGTHTFTLLKASECENGTVRIDSIRTDAESIAPTPAKERAIEFIGDSITCGYGVDAPNENEHFSTRTEDGTKTYAYKTAQALDMDYSMVSFSGFGIISGYATNGKRNTTSTVPQYYDKLGFSWWTDFDNGDPQMSAVDWDFNAFTPDVIVVNLGTNDNSYINGVKTSADKQAEREAYTAEYKEFIKLLREKNPDAYILCTLGIMGQELYDYMAKAVDEYVSETGDENVSAFKFDVQDMNDGLGADWHPSDTTHTKAANALVEELKPIIESLPEKPKYELPEASDVFMVSNTPTTLKLDWDDVEGAENYRVFVCRDTDELIGGAYEAGETSESEFTVEGLLPHTDYKISVVADIKFPDGSEAAVTSPVVTYGTADAYDITEGTIVFKTSNKTTYKGKNTAPAFYVSWNGQTLVRGIDYTASVKNGKNPGKATLIIKGKGDYEGKLTKNYVIVPAKSTQYKLVKPANGVLKASWSKSVGASGYQIWVSHRKAFDKCVKKYNIASGSKNTATVKGLTVCNRYYVKVRPYVTINGKRFYGAFSAVRNIRV